MSGSNASEKIKYDARWIGSHGIGRFAMEIGERISRLDPVLGKVNPSSPLDVIYITFKVLFYRKYLWLSPGYNAPLLGLSRYIFTIHDLNHIDLFQPGSKHALKSLYYRWIMRPACRRAAKVLTVSEYSRRRIIDWSGISEDSIVNVSEGVSTLFKPEGAVFASGYDYFLAVGNRKAHKNESRTMSAFAAADIDPSARLLFTGNPSEELRRLSDELGVSDRIEFLGVVSEEELAAYYRGAKALVFPSLYEGFGLPVIEAMACGTPVVTSTVTSLPEAAGGAALLVDPYNTQAIAEAMERVVIDKSFREGMVTKGLERARAFSWQDVSNKIDAVLAEEIKKMQGR